MFVIVFCLSDCTFSELFLFPREAKTASKPNAAISTTPAKGDISDPAAAAASCAAKAENTMDDCDDARREASTTRESNTILFLLLMTPSFPSLLPCCR